MYKTLSNCRICGNSNLVSILYLGEQYLTGVFPKTQDTLLTKGPLELVKCMPVADSDVCGLVQLKHSYDLGEMYGDTYGYRSGLNQSMVKHLQGKVNKILQKVNLKAGDVVIDIGSNDATLLKAYPNKDIQLYGVDPSAEKFRNFYTDNIQLITEFFPSETLFKKIGDKRAQIITSISMFYDLEEPVKFVKAVHDALDVNGVWVFEQSYMPTMLKTNSYDTVCHEHLEYYCVKQIKWMMDKVGFNIIDIELNNVNGGSFSVMVAKKESTVFKENKTLVDKFLEQEIKEGYNEIKTYEKFGSMVREHKMALIELLTKLKSEGKKVYGYGASTKGNVMLQYCNITSDILPVIAEVNEDKFGAYTPGTLIPIISESEAKAQNPDYYLVMPWHFKENFLMREKAYLMQGGKLIFALPKIEVITKDVYVDLGK
jgi:hypothetical protein